MLRIGLILLLFVGVLVAQESAPTGSTNGIVAVFRQGDKTDSLVLPDLALFVSSNSAPTFFLAKGPFTAELSGFVSVDLRASYTFRAVVSGELELLVNGAPVLNVQEAREASQMSKPVRLNRGRNAVLLHYKSPANGDSRLQVLWAAKNWPITIPLRSEALSHEFDAVLERSEQLRLGLSLVAEYRCTRCHAPDSALAPELDLGAPEFEGIGSRLEGSWMERWIANPFQPGAHMPRFFDNAGKPRAIAAYLSTLTANVESHNAEANRAGGEALFKSLHCEACHGEDDPVLRRMQQKFKPGALAAYLANPQAHYPKSPMPNFKLSNEEAESLAGYLNARATAINSAKIDGSIEQGRVLVQGSGCLNCHLGKLENKYSAPALSIVARAGLKGCLSTNATARAPKFDLKDAERVALATFLKSADFSGLGNPVPHELASREIERLRCAECHEKVEGLPRISMVGAKIQPGWAARFIAGDVNYKPRPWMTARMPAFPAEASVLARGLAALHGYSATTPAEPVVDPDQAQAGARLVSAAGGFSCVACHAVGTFTSGQVVETPGVNLAYAGERLLPDYFQRWVMNPVAIDPNTKMPVYFDAQGRSQLTEILEGDGAKPISAIWEYIKLGTRMPAPPTPR